MRQRVVSLFLALIAVLGVTFGISFADEGASVTSSGETLYYVITVPPAISVTPPSLDFGVVSVGNSANLTLTVQNNGAGHLIIGPVSSPSAPYSKTSDTCIGRILAQNGTCTITVKLTPTSNGTFPDSIRIPSNDPLTALVNIPITGTTIGPVINASPNPIDFGSVAVGGSSPQTLTLQNTGNANLTLGTIGAPAAPYSKIGGGTCTNGYTLTPSQTCTVVVQFSPTSSPGPFAGSFQVTSNAYNSPTLTINLTGVSTTAPQINVTPNPQDFGIQGVGSNTSNTITVRNTGSGNLILGSPAIAAPASPYSITSTTCTNGLSLVPNSTCTITVGFAPIAAGSSPASFVVTSNTGGNPGTSTTVNLTGSAALGTPSCSSSFTPATITSGGTSTISWASTNDADGQIPYSCTGNLGTGTFSGASGSAATSPTANQVCTLTTDNGSGTIRMCTATVTVVAAPTCTASFSPGSVPLGQVSTISWTSTGDADGQIPYSCTGNLGTGTFSGASGSASTSPTTTQTCTLSAQNAAGTVVTCPAVVTVTAGAPTCTASFSPATINIGQTSTLSWTSTNDADGQIDYSCTGNLGTGTFSGASGSASTSPSSSQVCTLQVDNGGGGTNTCTASITANGALINASPNPLDFGSHAAFSSTTLVVTVQNTGNSNLTFTSIGSPASPFSKLSTTCGASLTPNSTCTITLRFGPTSSGSFNGSFNIVSNAKNTPTLTINLTGNSLPQISITPNPYDFGPIASGSNASTTITVKNVGVGNLVLGNPALTSPSAPFSRTSTTCTNGLSLAANATCTITMKFSPTSNGAFNGSFTVSSNTGGVAGTLTTVNLTGTGSPPAPTCSASFSPASITSGATSTLSWTSTNDADGLIPFSCTGDLGSGTLSGANGSSVKSPTASQVCTLQVDNGVGGTSTCTATVTVSPAPSCSASFSPATITTPGGSSSLTWSSANDADSHLPYSCTGNLGNGTLLTASGTQSFTPTSTQTCTLTSQNAAGTVATCTATVTMNVPAPTCSASFSPTPITAGQTSSLTWSSTNDADSHLPYTCTGNLGNGTLLTASGTQSFTPSATQNCTYTVDNGAGSTNTCTATVTVVPQATCAASFSPASITTGGSSTLSWTLTNDADNSAPYTCTGNLGSGTASGASGSTALSPTASQSCTLTVANSLGATNTCTAAVTVTPPPTCSASFSPTPITAGQTSTLTWSSTNDADSHLPYTCTGNLGSGTLLTASGTQSFTPSATQSCTYTAQNAAGTTATCTATVTVVPQATCTTSFSPASITAGGSSTLSWTLTNDADNSAPYTCTGNLGSGTASGASGNTSLSPSSSQSCTLTVANSLGATNTCTAAVTVTPPPTCSASFSPTSITAGQTSSLTWSSTNDADGQIPYSCTGNLSTGTLTTASGTQSYTPTATQSCTYTVQNSAGNTATCTASVTVVPQATCAASFSPASINAGQTSTITWSSTNDADGLLQYSCTGNIGSGNWSASGSQSKSPTASQTCTLTAKNSLGSANTCTASVTVVPLPTCSCSFSPSSITVGQNSTLSWTLTNDADNSAPYTCTGNLGSGTLSGASGSASTSPTATQSCTLTAQNSLGATATCPCSITVTTCGQINDSPSSIDFGIVPVGVSEIQAVTVNNTGAGTLHLTSISSPAVPFSIASGGTCYNGIALASGGSCTIKVQVTPTSGGTTSGSFTITNDSQCTSQTATVSLTVQSIQASTSISTTGLYILYTGDLSHVNNSNVWQSTWYNAWYAQRFASTTLGAYGVPYLFGNASASTMTFYIANGDASYTHTLPVCIEGASYTEGTFYDASNSTFAYYPGNYSITLPPYSACIVYSWQCEGNAGGGPSWNEYGFYLDPPNGLSGEFTLTPHMSINPEPCTGTCGACM